MRHMLLMLAGTGVCVLTAALLVPGCHRGLNTEGTVVAEGETIPSPEAAAVVQAPRKDGARAWEQNCMRCHNLRSPRERSDRQWELIMHHMRVRANLTAEEHRLILTFLKSAN